MCTRPGNAFTAAYAYHAAALGRRSQAVSAFFYKALAGIAEQGVRVIQLGDCRPPRHLTGPGGTRRAG